VVNFDKLVEYGMISRSDLKLFRFADTAEGAWKALVENGLGAAHPNGTPIHGKDI